MSTIDITVKADAGVQYSIEVDNEDVDIENGAGKADVSSGKHFVSWHLIGNPGDGITVTVKQGPKTLVNKAPGKIPSDGPPGFGFRRIDVV